MTKPIFLVGLPAITYNTPESEDVKEKLDKMLQDYYCIFYAIDANKPEFQAFYDKDFTDIQYSELKDMIQKELKKLKK